MPTPEQMQASMLAKLEERTGKTLDEWVRIVHESGIEGQAKQRAWLKAEHGLKQNTTFLIADAAARAAGWTPPSDDALVDAMFAGPKAALRPIHDRLLQLIAALGPDVAVEARQTYVNLARKRQFAVIQPSTKTRLDLGLRLDGVAPEGRLELAKNVGGGSITHRIALESAAAVDAEVERWLRQAYETN